jgi:hypothetical protein
VLAKTSGRPVQHIDTDLDQHRAHFARSGRPDAWLDHTGNAPRSLAACAEEVFTC